MGASWEHGGNKVIAETSLGAGKRGLDTARKWISLPGSFVFDKKVFGWLCKDSEFLWS